MRSALQAFCTALVFVLVMSESVSAQKLSLEDLVADGFEIKAAVTVPYQGDYITKDGEPEIVVFVQKGTSAYSCRYPFGECNYIRK